MALVATECKCKRYSHCAIVDITLKSRYTLHTRVLGLSVRLGIRVGLGLDMMLRVLRFEVRFCLQTSFKVADFVCKGREDINLSGVKTSLKSGK